MNVIFELRNRAELTQALLAKLSGVTINTISRYETGTRSPTLAMLDRLASAAGFDVVVSFVPTRSDDDRPSATSRPEDRSRDLW